MTNTGGGKYLTNCKKKSRKLVLIKLVTFVLRINWTFERRKQLIEPLLAQKQYLNHFQTTLKSAENNHFTLALGTNFEFVKNTTDQNYNCIPIKEISNLWHSIYRVHVSTVSPTSKKTITKHDVRSLKQIIIKENFCFN